MPLRAMSGIESKLRALTIIVPTVVDAHGIGQRTCILQSRLAINALREIGHKAVPMACRVEVRSPALVEMLAELNGRQPTAEDAAKWAPRGAHLMGIGFGQGDEAGYDGHVVTIVDDRWLLDTSLPQVNRPEKGIHVTPVYFPVTSAWLAGEDTVGGTLNGTQIAYQAVPEDRGFLMVPDWRLCTPVEGISQDVTRQLRALTAVSSV